MEKREVPDSLTAALIVLFSIIFSFGGITNFLVLITHVEYYKKLLRDSKDVFIFSLAINDFVMSTFLTPLPLSSVAMGEWTTGEYGCIIYAFMCTWLGLSSILQLACFSIERYYTLSQFTCYEKSKRRAIVIVSLCWFISLGASLMPLFGLSRYTFEGYGLHCSIIWKRSHIGYCLFLLIFFFVAPLIAMAISYYNMFRIIRKIYSNAIRTWGDKAQVTLKTYTAQVKFMKQLAAVTVGFLVAWTPYAVLSCLRVLTTINFESGWFELPALFAKTANVYNPIIYFILYRRLRRHVSMFLNKVKRSVITINTTLVQ